MKRYIILLPILFFGFLVQSQYKISYTDSKKMYKFKGECKNKTAPHNKFGKWIGYEISSGKKVVEFYFKNDKRNGLFKTYYLNGNLKMKGVLEDNFKVGTWREYDKSGILIKTYACKRTSSDVRDIVERPYTNLVYEYKAGEFDYKDYHDRGRKSAYDSEDIYRAVGVNKANYPDGKIRYYNKSDQFLGYSYYEEGRKVGKSVRYFSDPELKHPRYFGIMKGIGAIYAVRRNKEGNITSLYSSREYKVEDGYYEIYDDDNVIKERRCYSNGKYTVVSSESECGSSSTSKDDKEKTEEDVEVKKSYYSNGALRYAISYKNEMKEGVAKWYYESGKLRAEEHYSSGKPDGLCKFYYSSGELKYTKQFKAGKVMNVKGSYFKNGKSNYFGTLKNGNGTHLVYKDDGITIEEIKEYKNGNLISIVSKGKRTGFAVSE